MASYYAYYTFWQPTVGGCGHWGISPFQNSKTVGYRWHQCWADGLGWHVTLFYLHIYNKERQHGSKLVKCIGPI